MREVDRRRLFVSFGVFLRDDSGTVRGGIVGHIKWRWMYIAKPEEGIGAPPKIAVHPSGVLVLVVTTAGMLIFGMIPHLLNWAEIAAAAGF